MRKSFTLIELIIVIVIMGILSTITFDILQKVYKNYIFVKETNRLNYKVNYALEEISALMKNRIKNSVIATAYPIEVNQTDSSKVDFDYIGEIEENTTKYKVLEWLGKDYEAKNGMWDESQKRIQTGWSGFIDLDKASKTDDDPQEFNVTTLYSNFDVVKIIDANITSSLGDDTNIFDDNITTLVFSFYDMGGELSPDQDINHSFGWYLDKDRGREARSIFAIQNYIQHSDYSVDLNITRISEYNETELYARYFLVRTAYSLVPIENNTSTTNDYNLTLYYNYRPWKGDWWNKRADTGAEANHTLVLNHVTQFRFKKDLHTDIFRIYICVQSSFLDINATNKLEVCKERMIY